jgi:recombination protein RecA
MGEGRREAAQEVLAAARAAERLLRSGAFGLVVLDLVGAAVTREGLPIAVQGRLVTLTQTHDAAVVALTDKPADAASLGSLVSLRADALRGREDGGEFGVTVRALKDKQRGPGWSWHARRRGPAGLR